MGDDGINKILKMCIEVFLTFCKGKQEWKSDKVVKILV